MQRKPVTVVPVPEKRKRTVDVPAKTTNKVVSMPGARGKAKANAKVIGAPATGVKAGVSVPAKAAKKVASASTRKVKAAGLPANMTVARRRQASPTGSAALGVGAASGDHVAVAGTAHGTMSGSRIRRASAANVVPEVEFDGVVAAGGTGLEVSVDAGTMGSGGALGSGGSISAPRRQASVDAEPRDWGGDAIDRLSPVNPARISDTIVEQIRALIRQGHLQPGDRLPNERKLCERFGVSRVSVRDALRILEASGLIEIRVGARGGAFLTAPTAAGVGARLSDMLTMSSLSAQEVTEARVVFELGIIDLICARADDTDLAELAEICERSSAAVEAHEYSMDLSLEFHVRLARAAHNQAIDLIVSSFQQALRMSLFEAHAVAPLMGVAGTDEHWELVEALRRRDSRRAREVMTTHLARTTARLQSSSPSRPTLPVR